MIRRFKCDNQWPDVSFFIRYVSGALGAFVAIKDLMNHYGTCGGDALKAALPLRKHALIIVGHDPVQPPMLLPRRTVIHLGAAEPVSEAQVYTLASLDDNTVELSLPICSFSQWLWLVRNKVHTSGVLDKEDRKSFFEWEESKNE